MTTGAATLPTTPPAAFVAPRATHNACGCGLPLVCAVATPPSQLCGCVCVFLGSAFTPSLTGDLLHQLQGETLLLSNGNTSTLHAPPTVPNILRASCPCVAMFASKRELVSASLVLACKAAPLLLLGDQVEASESLRIPITAVDGPQGDLDALPLTGHGYARLSTPINNESGKVRYRQSLHQFRNLDQYHPRLFAKAPLEPVSFLNRCMLCAPEVFYRSIMLLALMLKGEPQLLTVTVEFQKATVCVSKPLWPYTRKRPGEELFEMSAGNSLTA